MAAADCTNCEAESYCDEWGMVFDAAFITSYGESDKTYTA